MAKTIGQLDLVTTFNPSTDEFVIEQSGQTFKVAASVVRGGLVNADIDAAAAIVYSKLDLDDSIVAGDLTADAVTTAKIEDDAVTTAKILDANVTPAKLSQPYTLRTAQNSTSGPSIDFTDIPSWAKRITVMFDGVSLSGTSAILVQLGDSGGIETTGYESSACNQSGTVTSSTSGYVTSGGLATLTSSGIMTIAAMGSNLWISSHTFKLSTLATGYGGGNKTLSGTLDRVRITTVNGTDTFDAGSINISYEG